jgi:spore coat polysaccharide biosynthesis protein SpsF (cytidylyltransferase family)
MAVAMKVVAIIQARMNSARLPGKVLLPLAGKPVLKHIVDRLRNCQLLTQVVVATSNELSDVPVVEFCSSNQIDYYRGSLNDVLDRYYQAGKEIQADVIVRITGDCPLIDPVIVDAVIAGYLAGDYDLYGLTGEFPDGLDCTVFSFSAIEKAWNEASLKSEREHVGPYIENNPKLFKTGGLHLFHGLAAQRWTLDEPQDYELLTQIFDELYSPSIPFYSHDILQLMGKRPELPLLNHEITRNAGYIKSLQEDD